MLASIIRIAALVSLCTASARAQVGRPLPRAEVGDFAQTEARSLDDLVGRTVLIEFFAYW